MTKPSRTLILAAAIFLAEGAAAQDVPAAAPAKDPSCTALRAEVAQIERDMRAESTAMSKAANDMRKKMMSRGKAARAGGLFSSLAGMIPGVGMAASLGTSLVTSAASAGGGRGGMPKEMEQAMERQTALSDRMVVATQALHDKCGEDYVDTGPTMTPEEIKALEAEARAAAPQR